MKFIFLQLFIFLLWLLPLSFNEKSTTFTSQFRYWRKFAFILALDENIVSKCRCCGLLYISSGLLLKSLFWRAFPTHPFCFFPSCCYCGISRKETQVHKLCLSHILLFPCSQEEWNGNQGLDKLHGVSLDPALMVLLCRKPACRRCWRKERDGSWGK